MAQVTIKIYHSDGAVAPEVRHLVRTVRLQTSSQKRLTSKRAGQNLANEFPKFESARRGMIKTEEGWMATRSLRPTEHCSFHYIWEKAVVYEDVKSVAPSE